jgi:inner membrane protein
LLDARPTNMADPRIALWARNDPAARAFLSWSRMPVAELHPDRIVLTDQRFAASPVRSGFTVTLRATR